MQQIDKEPSLNEFLEALSHNSKDHDISLQDVVFVDDTIPFLREAERKGIKSFHISSFLDWDFEGRQKC